ncbi:hypothetical protein AbraIFM66951_007601 [Aspergillus brasiliensis]|uniref:cAMP-dependent protein kinase regulatory subunit n=1 Tax=Aspergillus brasiliensis TaxID=319629 RepID=A0A9W5YTG4_9EURO|nr:hypothetical protein AbraCBS73388_009895 [Aspergillus brasiliensis]GKZ41046.1 hypothetical protein AbraIFM66951_007601 [Aspergillus brasiliensis]
MPGRIGSANCSHAGDLPTSAPEERPEVSGPISFQDPFPLCPRASALPGTGGNRVTSPYSSPYISPRRNSVSAESFVPGQQSLPNNSLPKTEEQAQRLMRAVKEVFLFSALDKEQHTQVLNAFVEKVVPSKGTIVITQGDIGDNFYIVEKGTFDFYINPASTIPTATPSTIGAKHGSAHPGDFFGELALLYNAPRAATIISTEPDCLLWALDGVSFRCIMAESAFARRQVHTSFLERIPLLAGLSRRQRSRIAEALQTRRYRAGETIIRQGDLGSDFFLLVSGEARAYKVGSVGSVKTYTRGGWFGERAFRKNAPRAASIMSVTDVIVAVLHREAFGRLLGPVEEIMRSTAYGGVVDDEVLRTG